MKTIIPASQKRPKVFWLAFSLVELMVTMGVFSLLIIAMVSVQLFAARVYTLAATKLIACTGGRETMNMLRDQIRSAKIVYVGTYSNSQFAVIPSGQSQVGNALQICPSNTVGASNFIVYYMDPSRTNMCSISNGVVNVLATCITNYNCFWAEDYQGNVMTNYLNNPVIRMQMQFVQWEYPIAHVGGSGANAYDYYYLRTRITRRSKS